MGKKMVVNAAPVLLNSRFSEILGAKRGVFTENQRKLRWEGWKRLAVAENGEEAARYWEDITACAGCQHLNEAESWCTIAGLPCTVNPILTFRMGIIGMACKGLHYTPVVKQLGLFDEPIQQSKSGGLEPEPEAEPENTPTYDKIMSVLEELNRSAEHTNNILTNLIMELNPDCSTMEEVNERLNPKPEPKQIKEVILNMEALDFLQQATVDGNVVKLPNLKLDRNDYETVKSKLELIGGKWKGGKVQGFVFQEDPTELLQSVLTGDNRNLKKEFQFFGTPDLLADRLVQYADPLEGHEILEPSAGQGAIVKAINRYCSPGWVDCYELMPLNVLILTKISTVKLLGDDFLKAPIDKRYDRIIANPPFSKNQDIDHILKMAMSLNDGGRLVTVASKHWQLSDKKKETNFRNWLANVGAEIIEVDAGAFKESGTSVATCIIIINK